MTSIKAPTSHYYRMRRQADEAPLGIISWPISWDLFSEDEFQAILELKLCLQPVSYPINTLENIKFDVKRPEKNLFLCVIADALE